MNASLELVQRSCYELELVRVRDNCIKITKLEGTLGFIGNNDACGYDFGYKMLDYF